MPAINLFLGCFTLGVALLVSALAVPLVRGRIAPNSTYGARFAKAFESDENWYAINAYSGRRLLVWSIPVAALGVASFFLSIEGRSGLILALSLAPVLYLVPCLEACRFARRL